MQDILKTWTDERAESRNAVQTFKAVFLTEQGQYVLARMLEKLKFFEHCENEQDMALNNFAKDLLATIYWSNESEKVNSIQLMNFLKKLIRRTKKCRTK